MQNRERAISSLPEEEEMRHDFMVAFTRLAERAPGHSGAFYEPTLHYVLIPRIPNPATYLLTVQHEMAHAKLGTNAFAFTIESLHAIEVLLSKVIGGRLDGLSELLGEESADLSSHFRTIAERQEAARVAAPHQQFIDKAWVSTAGRDKVFRKAVESMLFIEHRRRTLIRHARSWHEGFATFVELSADENDPDDYMRDVESLFAHLSPADKAAVRTVIHTQVSEMKESIRADSRSVPWPYRNGYRLYSKIAESLQDVRAPFAAALIAANFPYYTCDPLRASEDEFAKMVNDTRLNMDERIRSLAEFPDLIGTFLASGNAAAALDHLRMGHEWAPISEGANNFDQWEEIHLFDYAFSELDLPRQSVFDDYDSQNDWRSQIVVPDQSEDPVFVTHEGVVKHPDARFRRLFMQRIIDHFGLLWALDMASRPELRDISS